MKTVRFPVEGMTCPSCSQNLETVLRRETGVVDVQVLFTLGKVKIVYDETVTSLVNLKKAIERSGYQVSAGAK